MKIQANISISRNSSDEMTIRVQDETSRANFLVLTLTPADLMSALTGLAFVDAKSAEVNGLDVVGKKKITERRTAVYPGNSLDSKDKMQKWLSKNCMEDGWIIDLYLGSQSSIGRSGDKATLNYSVYRYEAIADQAAPQGDA